SRPGYAEGINMALDQNDRRMAARGMLGSGNTIADTTKLATDYSNQKYSDYLSSFSPMLNLATGAASGIAGLNSQLGNLNYQRGRTHATRAGKARTGTGDATAAADF